MEPREGQEQEQEQEQEATPTRELMMSIAKDKEKLRQAWDRFLGGSIDLLKAIGTVGEGSWGEATFVAQEGQAVGLPSPGTPWGWGKPEVWEDEVKPPVEFDKDGPTITFTPRKLKEVVEHTFVGAWVPEVRPLWSPGASMKLPEGCKLEQIQDELVITFSQEAMQERVEVEITYFCGTKETQQMTIAEFFDLCNRYKSPPIETMSEVVTLTIEQVEPDDDCRPDHII